MRQSTASGNIWVVAAMLALCGVASAADPPSRDARSPKLEQLMPQWKLGDRWIVETTSRAVQVRGAVPESRSRPIQWQFAVDKFEKSLTDDCYRIEVRCMAGKNEHPRTVLWIDRKSRVIRQIQTELPVPGGYRTVIESYDFPSGQPSPVLGLLTALPLDLPSFLGDQGKGLQTFTYETHEGPAGAKALGTLGFAYEVQQQTAIVPPDEVKQLLHESYAKGLESDPVVEIRLKGPNRSVRQLWRPSLPWPLYSETGESTCRLVKVQHAGERANKPEEPHP